MRPAVLDHSYETLNRRVVRNPTYEGGDLRFTETFNSPLDRIYPPIQQFPHTERETLYAEREDTTDYGWRQDATPAQPDGPNDIEVDDDVTIENDEYITVGQDETKSESKT